jgi:hypothetical protein
VFVGERKKKTYEMFRKTDLQTTVMRMLELDRRKKGRKEDRIIKLKMNLRGCGCEGVTSSLGIL